MNIQINPLFREHAEVVAIDRTPFTIGRLPDCNLPMVHEDVSRQHCTLINRNGRLYVRNLQSSNGTFVNGRHVRDELPLQAGDLLSVGLTAFQVGCDRSSARMR